MYFGVGPVLFALYLKLRVAELHMFHPMTINEYSDAYIKHFEVCQCDKKVYRGKLVVGAALYLYYRSQEQFFYGTVVKHDDEIYCRKPYNGL